jgi:hypothetical protein
MRQAFQRMGVRDIMDRVKKAIPHNADYATQYDSFVADELEDTAALRAIPGVTGDAAGVPVIFCSSIHCCLLPSTCLWICGQTHNSARPFRLCSLLTSPFSSLLSRPPLSATDDLTNDRGMFEFIKKKVDPNNVLQAQFQSLMVMSLSAGHTRVLTRALE